MANIDGSKLDDLILMFAPPFFIDHTKATDAPEAQVERVATDRIVRGDDATMIL